MESADVGGSVAEEGHGHLTALAVFGGEPGADRNGRAGADDAVGAEHAEVEIVDVHRASLAFAVAGALRHELGHHPFEIAALGYEVAVSAVGGRDGVVIIQVRADTRCHGLLADIQMEEAGQPRCFGQLARGFLEQSDTDHAVVQVVVQIGRHEVSPLAQRNDRRRSS